jgi:hypothetical protein
MVERLEPDRKVDGDLDEVRDKRRKLRHAVADLEEALATAAGRPGPWSDRVAAALAAFQEALERHVALTERGDGLYTQILDHAPRLSAKVDRLRREHDEMAAEAAELLARCRGDELDEDAIEAMRRDALDLLGIAVRHRQVGADLLYEAYEVDIAAAD